MSDENTNTANTEEEKKAKTPNTNSFSLDENPDIRVEGEGLTADIILEEILYFPRIPKSDEDKGDEEELWVLDDAQYKKYKELTEKYATASKELVEAKKANDPKRLKTAQDKMREMILIAEGKKPDQATSKATNGKSPLPVKVPQGDYQGLTEGVGFRDEKYFYLGAKDLKILKSIRKKKSGKFRFPIKLKNNKEATVKAAYDAAYPEEQSKKDKIDQFKKAQAKIKAEWKIDGQVASKVLSYGSPLLSAFLNDDDFELIDKWVSDFNKKCVATWNDSKNKVKYILELLKEGNDDFTDEDWAEAKMKINALWSKTHKDFANEATDYLETPTKSQRNSLIQKIKKQELPPANWDATAAAQIMRYSAGLSAEAGYNLAEGKVFGKLGGEAKFSLLEAGAEFNYYFPDDKGWGMKFKIPVKKTTYSFREYDKYDPKKGYNAAIQDGSFPFDSFFVTPTVILALVQQLAGAKMELRTQKFKQILFAIIGHTDAKGSHGYNDKLGLLRASAAHAVFSNDAAEWSDYFEFKKNAWGDDELEFMREAIFIADYAPDLFDKALLDPTTSKSDDTIAIINSRLAVYSKLAEARLNPLDEVVVIGKKRKSSEKLTRARRKYFEAIRALSDKLDRIQISRSYFEIVLKIIIQKVPGIEHSDLKQFFFTESDKSIRSLGKRALAEATLDKSSKNRRVELEPYKAYDPKTKIVDQEVDFGDGRFKFKGGVSLFVGATIALSAEVEINAPKGVLMITGKKNKEDQPVKYGKDRQIQDTSESGDNNVTAKAEAFAGAQAEAKVALELEWQNPNKRGKHTGGFQTLASVGYALTGSAGAGITGEFKIGYDRESQKFQIKMMAKATWGIGGGGAVSFVIGARELWDFVRLVYHKLNEVDFNFLDLFEQETDEHGNSTDSRINVYEVFTAWSVEMLKKGFILQAGMTYIAGGALDGAITILKDVDNLLDKWQDVNQELDDVQTLVASLKEKPEMIDYLLPESKGRILFILTKERELNLASMWDKLGDTWTDFRAWDKNYENEEAALFLITKGIDSVQEWEETMEHMTYCITNADGEKEYQAFVKTKDTNHYGTDALQKLAAKTPLTPQEIEQKAARQKKRIQDAKVYLRNYLLSDTEDWEKVERHVNNLYKKSKDLTLGAPI